MQQLGEDLANGLLFCFLLHRVESKSLNGKSQT